MVGADAVDGDIAKALVRPLPRIIRTIMSQN